MGLILTVKFSFLLDFESVSFEIFCMRNCGRSLSPDITLFMNGLSRELKYNRAKGKIQSFSEFIKTSVQTAK